MATIQTLYPQSNADTVAITISLASLASTAAGVLLAGRASTAVDNTSNLDLDHLVSGRITVGTSPTANRQIEVWAYAPFVVASGTPTYPDSITGTDANKTMTSYNVKVSALIPLWGTFVDNTSDRPYFMPPTSIAEAFGGMPTHWGLFIVHDTNVNLNATAGNHEFNYLRKKASVI
jgi:hypothetical protein